MSLRSRLGALQERGFRLLFLGRTASQLGDAVAPVALAFAILDDLDGSATALGLVLAAAWVPQILFTLLGGVWADRLPRNLVMVGTDLAMFGAQAAVAVLLLSGSAELWQLAALQIVRGTATAFFFPASIGLVPQVVSPGRLQQANALLRLSNSSTRIVGAAIGGAAVAAFGPGWALAFDAATFLVSAFFLSQIRLPRGIRIPGSNIAIELREGWDEFRSRTWLWAIVIGAFFGNVAFGAVLTVLGPVVADRELGGAAAWGAIVAATGVGSLAGGLLALRVRPARPLVPAMIGILVAVLPLLLLAVSAPVAAIAIGAFVAGAGLQLFGIVWDTTLQQQIPRDRLSRVSAWDLLGSLIAIPLGLTVVGPIAATIGVAETLLLFSAVLFIPNALVLLSRDVRRLEA